MTLSLMWDPLHFIGTSESFFDYRKMIKWKRTHIPTRTLDKVNAREDRQKYIYIYIHWTFLYFYLFWLSYAQSIGKFQSKRQGDAIKLKRRRKKKVYSCPFIKETIHARLVVRSCERNAISFFLSSTTQEH